MHVDRRTRSFAFLAALAALGLAAPAASAQSAQSVALVRNRQYDDAIKLLTREIAGQPDAQTGRPCLLLGECYFLTRQYDQARVCFQKARANCTDDADKLSAEFRLACVAFRAKDDDALQRIDTYVGDHAADSRAGLLLVYRMMIVAEKGPSAQAQMEQAHDAIYARIHDYGAPTAGDADQVLCDFYRKIGAPDKAEALYARVALSLARQINDRRTAGEAVPASMEKAHDNAALQLGVICLDQSRKPEAVKWLETVRYDVEMKIKARLFLAKLAYEGNDFAAVSRYVGDKDFLAGLPPGPIRSDVYLVLGLAEKANPNGSPQKIEDFLREVAPEARGYAQAQSALGDLYRTRLLPESALKAYANAVADPDYAADALFWTGSLHIDLAAKDAAAARGHYLAAAAAYKELVEKYPASPLIKQVREKAPLLAAQGLDVQFALGDQENRRNWQRVASEKPGTPEAAQALLSLMRSNLRQIVDAKTGQFAQAPDYPAAAAAADQLLDAKVYSGAGLDADSFKALIAEANYARGKAELASIGRHAAGEGRFLQTPAPSADRAAAYFTTAQRNLLNGQPADLARAIELGLLEARFKSDQPQQRDAAQKSFGDLADRYGNDPQFQALGLTIADWLHQQSRFADAARQYALVADHARDMKPDDLMKLWFTAGSLWSRAGEEALGKPDAAAYTVLIYPKETLILGDAFLRSYPPLQRSIDMHWPRMDNPSAYDALRALSQNVGIPFICSKSITAALADKKIALKDGPATPADVLAMLLDPAAQRVALNTGLTADAATTLAAPSVDPDDPDGGKLAALEIYDPRTANSRYKPLLIRYGELPKTTRDAGLMLYSVVQHVEDATGTRITWSDGIDRQAKLETELTRLDGISPASPCIDVLEKALDQAGLRCRLDRIELAPQYFDNARDCFNKARKIDPKSTYGERALIAVAVNFYQLKDYDKMRIILREYLKTFDATTSAYYQQACFWVGWAFENQRNYRDAAAYYARAAEERLVIVKPAAADAGLSRDQLRAQLSNDSQVALLEPISGELKAASVEGLAEFARTRGHVNVRIDPAAQIASGQFDRGAFTHTPVFDIFCDGLDKLGLSFRVENLSPDIAEKALFRLASVYQKDGAMDQAVEACNLLLMRYPNTTRRRDIQTLMIGIYKGLNQYGKVVATLQQLRGTATDPDEIRRLDYQLAASWFDMADFARASEAFKAVLSHSPDGSEALAARDAWAKSLFREGRLAEAQAQFAQLAQDEPETLRKLTYVLMAFTLDELLGKVTERAYPLEAQKWILNWEQLSDARRAALSANEFAQATWIYYTMALIDLHQGRRDDAVKKLTAVTNSPDDFIASDAAYRIAILALEDHQPARAREDLETLLLTARSSETNARALFALGQVWESLGRPDRAIERYHELIARYPLSPYVAMARARPVWNTATASQPATNP